MRATIAAALAALIFLFIWPLFAIIEVKEGEQPEVSDQLEDSELIQTVQIDSQRELVVQLGSEQVTMAVDAYLWGVVAAEMPATFESAALEAQGLTARTYAYNKMERGNIANHLDADVCTDHTCCQAYISQEQAYQNWGEMADTYSEKIRQAVSNTDNQVILYDGNLIDAVFFSSTDGSTKDAVEVWGSSVPYLTGVDSPEGDTVPQYESWGNVTISDFKDMLVARYSGLDFSGSPDSWVVNGLYTTEICGVNVSNTALRSMFGLRSASFELTGTDQGMVFHVTGYGHGVGMSQYGANDMAKSGATAEEIVTHYYSGVNLASYSS